MNYMPSLSRIASTHSIVMTSARDGRSGTPIRDFGRFLLRPAEDAKPRRALRQPRLVSCLFIS